MRFAQFYRPSTGWNGRDYTGPVTLIPACGSDSILYIDGRFSDATAKRLARETCEKRGFNAFTLHAGASLLSERQTCGLQIVKPL